MACTRIVPRKVSSPHDSFCHEDEKSSSDEDGRLSPDSFCQVSTGRCCERDHSPAHDSFCHEPTNDRNGNLRPDSFCPVAKNHSSGRDRQPQPVSMCHDVNDDRDGGQPQDSFCPATNQHSIATGGQAKHSFCDSPGPAGFQENRHEDSFCRSAVISGGYEKNAQMIQMIVQLLDLSRLKKVVTQVHRI